MAENTTELSEIESEEFSNVTTPETSETLNNEPEFEEIEPVPNPWDNAPQNVWFFDKQYADGHLGNMTQSAERAYKRGWDIENNYIPISDVQQSDKDYKYYHKDQCPMKSDEDLQKDAYREEIVALKKQLSNTDYKAIKYAEGAISEEEYAEVKELRQGWRDRINELEELINE